MPQIQTPAASPFLLLLIIILVALTPLSYCDVGTAAHYKPPYTPTACYGSDPTQFPSSNLFGAAGEGIWDNGAACGRQYLVRCISAAVAGACVPNQTIQVRIVDRTTTATSLSTKADATIVLSTTAFSSIANASLEYVNIEFQQWAPSLSINILIRQHAILAFWKLSA
ncbi:hypothetical protein SAY87_023249 [Trapa incisa]|uniref:Expansin-like EG45 domain-containing protein n=1 Tax=Trapa incisa TaxID=236973 RepID=A0AAN7K949_9MYRT|nr:hypothetical protein SAY87_023249 [Trapa incisa]